MLITNLPDHQFVLGRDLRPGEEEIVLAPRTGGTITGRLHLPAGATPSYRNVAVSVLGFHLGGEVAEDGSFTIQGVPPGTWEVTGSAQVDGVYRRGSVQAAAGADVDIQLEPR